MVVPGCDKEFCGVSAPRCASCLYTFVAQPGEVCDECGTGRCTICRHKVTLLYDKFPSGETINSVMGFGAYTGICKVCQEHSPHLGDAKICQPCAVETNTRKVCYHCLQNTCIDCDEEELVLDALGRCPKCNSKASWYSVTNLGDLPIGKCEICHSTRPVNINNICKFCHESSESFRRCVNCSSTYVATEGFEMLCSSCKPRCLACNRSFNPLTKVDMYCNTCFSNIASNTCNTCGNNTREQLDEKGNCPNCSRDRYALTSDSPDRYFCPICAHQEVDGPKTPCSKCAQKTDFCPHCQGSKKVIDYLCNTCLEAEMVMLDDDG